MGVNAQVKGVVDTNRESELEGIKRRLREGLDGRPITWLAEKTGDVYKNVQRWVNGEVEPPLDFIPRYCKATDTSIEWVMTERGPKRPVTPSEAERLLQQVRQILLPMPRELFKPMPRPDANNHDTEAGGS